MESPDNADAPSPPEDLGMLAEQASALEAIEELAAAVRAGEVLEFVGMVVKTDGTFYAIGGKAADRHEMAGMLMHLAMERLSAP